MNYDESIDGVDCRCRDFVDSGRNPENCIYAFAINTRKHANTVQIRLGSWYYTYGRTTMRGKGSLPVAICRCFNFIRVDRHEQNSSSPL